MAKRTYNRRGRQTAKTPVRTDGRGRAQRQTAARVSRDTGSKDRVTRGRGVTRTASGAPRGAQGPRTAPQQGPNRKVSGIIGTRQGSTKTPTNPPPTPGTKLGKIKPGQMASNVVNAAARRIVGDGSAAAFQMAQIAAEALRQQKASQNKTKAKPASSVGKYNTKDKDGTVRSRAKVGPKKVGTVAESFDKSFAAARKAGKKTFTFKGKKYTTKMKGE